MNTPAGISKSTTINPILLRDIFTKDDPAALNVLMHEIQCERFEVMKTFVAVGNTLAKSRRAIHSYLRANYKDAIEQTKKNAGIEALELWAAATAPDLADHYANYVELTASYAYLEKVLSALNKDMDAVEARINIFTVVR